MEEVGSGDSERYSWNSATPDPLWFQQNCMICGEYVAASGIEKEVIMDFLVFDTHMHDFVLKRRLIQCIFHPQCAQVYCIRAGGA